MDRLITEAGTALGFSCLKDEQRLAISEFVNGKDVFVILPTGFGKTVCFSCLPYVFDSYQKRTPDNKSIIIVVSPLTALIRDQVENLSSRNVSVGFLDCDSSKETEENVSRGEYSIVFLGPELLVQKWRKLLLTSTYKLRLVGLIIDEAHCVVKWGLSFRESFARIKEVRSAMSSTIGIMALTATVTKEVREKVEGLLGMRNPTHIIRSPDKTNVSFSLLQIKGCNSFEVPTLFNCILEDLKLKLTSFPRVIIFCKLKSHCAKLFTFFRTNLGKYFTEPPGAHTSIVECRLVDMFFKGTSDIVKQKIVSNFTVSSCLRIVICTDAFGMGIDCKEVQLIIHYGVPSDTETYVQQIGRAGRGGEQSYGVLFYSAKLLEHCEQSIKSYVENTRSCRRNNLFKNFESYQHAPINKGCQCCDICAQDCDCHKCVNNLSHHYSFMPMYFNIK